MPPIFLSYKKRIDDFLLTFLDSKKEPLAQVNAFGPDLVARVKNIVTRGKTVRGSLVLLSYSFANKKPSENAIKVAAALELLHTALLVHDDIMDHDDVRRGQPTLHKQYDSEAVAMCVGDILFFMAFELLGTLETDEKTLGRITRFVGREYQLVGVAEMTDVAKTAKTKEEILNLFTYKTARYTFAVPLMLGAMLAGTTKEQLRYLESFGVAVGVLFQIQDDKLDHEKNPFTEEDIQGYTRAAEESLKRLTMSPKDKKILQELMHFVQTRTT